MFSKLRRRLGIATEIAKLFFDAPRVPPMPVEYKAGRRRSPAPLDAYMPDGAPYHREPLERLINILHIAAGDLPALPLRSVTLRPIEFPLMVDVEAVFMSRDGRVTQVVNVAVEQKQGKIIENWWNACSAAVHERPKLGLVPAVAAGVSEPTENGAGGLENPARRLHRATDQIPND